ncbi:MAG TPA: PDZ domain-containing protein [Vicinamibacteria bacterium]
MVATLLALLALPPADLAAVGIVLSPRPDASSAILRAGGRTRVVGVGDSAFGGKVAAISPGTVTVVFDEQRTELRLSGEVSAAALPPPRPPERGPAAGQVMERREVERRLGAEVPRILAETTVMPVTDGGRPAGLVLTRLPEGTLLSDAGLRPGDVLTQINDIAIDSLATLIALYPRLQGESQIRAVVLRDGRPVTLSVTLR